MTPYDKFSLCYEARDFEGAGQIVYDYINESINQGAALPLEWKPTFSTFLKELYLEGDTFQNELQFLELCHGIYSRIIQGASS